MNREKFEKVESLLSKAQENLNEAMPKRESGKELEGFEGRDVYLEEFNSLCEKYGFEVELEEDMDKDQIFSDWQDEVNMSASDLKKWSKNPCSRQASQEPLTVMKRNLRLLERNKDEWTDNDFEDAKRTISFISRMRGMRPESPREGPHGCPSEWAISLLNWAYNPFDSVPTPSSEVKEDLEPVKKVSLSSKLQERRNIKEAEMLAEQVWVMKDVMQEFEEEFEAIAMSLENEEDLDEVKRMRERTVSAVDLMMDKLGSPVETVKNKSVEQLQEADFEFSPVPDQVVYFERELAAERARALGMEGDSVEELTHEHVLILDDEQVTMYMAGGEHRDWAEIVSHPRQLEDSELSDSRQASEIVHGDQEKHLKGSDEEDDGVRVSPVAIHKVEGGSTEVEVDEDVEKVLDELWE